MFTQILRWITIGGLMAVPVVLPFIVSASMFFPYITGKNFTFRIIVEVVLLAWMLLAFLDAKYRPRFSWILSAFALFVVVVGVADMFGANSFKSFWSNFERMEGYIAILHVFAYFVVAGVVLNTERLWNGFWYASLGASVAVVFVALKPVFEVLPDISAMPRIDATFGNPIYLAVYSLFHIFIALVLMARWRGTHWHQGILGIVAMLHVVAMVLTMTRGTVLGFLGGAVVTTILIAALERQRVVLRRVAAGALVVLVLVVGAGVFMKDTEWAKTTPVVNRFTQISLDSGTVNARFMNWGMAWQGVQERPLLGWGQGNYEYVFSKHYDPEMYAQEPWFDRTHNIFFDWLISAGFLGLITYLLIPIALMVHLWLIDPHERSWSWRSLTSASAIRTLVKKRDDAFPATERALWTGLIAAYMFHNLFVFDNILSYIFYASVLAYLHWRVTEGHPSLWAQVSVTRETVLAVALPIVLVVGGLSIWYINVPGIRTSQLLIAALIPQREMPDGTVIRQTPEDMLGAYERALEIDQLGRQEVREQLAQRAAQFSRSEDVSPDTKIAFRDLAIVEMERELERNPDSARLQLFMGSLYSNIGRMQEAEVTLLRAVELTPTKQTARFQLGEIQMILGKTEEGLGQFQYAYELLPEFKNARNMYATALIRSGNDKQAVDLLTEEYGTPAVDDSRIFMAWIDAKRYDIAAVILEERVARNPDDIQQIVSLAAAYKELGRTEEAVRMLRDVAERYPEYAGQMEEFIAQLEAS